MRQIKFEMNDEQISNDQAHNKSDKYIALDLVSK